MINAIIVLLRLTSLVAIICIMRSNNTLHCDCIVLIHALVVTFIWSAVIYVCAMFVVFPAVFTFYLTVIRQMTLWLSWFFASTGYYPVHYAEAGDKYFANSASAICQEQSVREGVSVYYVVLALCQ